MEPNNAPRVLRDAHGRGYRVVRRLGRGSAGEVLLATVEAGLSRPVAIKLLHGDSDDARIRRLRDEASMLAGLDHPVILSVDDLLELDGRAALVTEFVEGTDLRALVYGRDPLPRGPVLDVIEQVADALHVAWSALQLVHRDVKPENIRIGVHGNVKLIDFGIARAALLDRSAHTTTGTVLGTMPYLAPERYDLDDAPLKPSSDIFALGCVLYEAWTRERFFEDLTGTQLLAVTDTPSTYEPWLRRRLAAPSLGPVADLLRGMLAFDPRRRPGALAVAQQCDHIASGLPMRLTLRRWARQRRAESGPTERVSAVDAHHLELEELSATDMEEPTAVTLPDLPKPPHDPLTAPTFTRPPRADAPPRPAPLELPPSPSSQATTRWIAPVVVLEDDDDIVRERRGGGWAATAAATVVVLGGAALLVAAWVSGTVDAILP